MRIEELAHDLQASANISNPPGDVEPPVDLLTQAINAHVESAPPTVSEYGTTPALPPGMEEMQNKTVDEILKDLNKLPLFMTELEDSDGLEALKALAYEGTALEVASGFKERGNESFKEKRWKDAKEFYLKAVNILIIEVRKRQKMSPKEEQDLDKEEVKKEIAVLEASLVNRAACHLELKNYRSCIQDCGSALRINHWNIKAYYRSSKALLGLDKIPEADDSCAHGLAIDPNNKALQGVAKEIAKRNQVVAARKKRELERAQRIYLEAATLKAALKARSIKTRKTKQPPEMEDAKIELVPDPVDPTSTLSFPAVLLYPLHLESDFIKSFNETETLGHHLSYILPVPWDKQTEYIPKGVECYMETVPGGLIKVGRNVPLLKVLSEGDVEIVDEVVKIFIVPKSKASEWIQDFKTKKLAEQKTSS